MPYPWFMHDGGVTRTLATPDGPVAVLETGDGPAVLFVPGYTGTKEDFAPLLPLLADAGLRAVAMDLPGQYETPGTGRSGRVHAAGAVPLGARGRGRELDRPHLVGHSLRRAGLAGRGDRRTGRGPLAGAAGLRPERDRR